MTENVLNTIISSLTAIIVAIIGIAQIRQSRRTKDINEQVVNSHGNKTDNHGNKIGLRDDIDEIKFGLKSVIKDVGGLRQEQRQTRKEVYDLRVFGQDNRHRIHELEQTQPTIRDRNDDK